MTSWTRLCAATAAGLLLVAGPTAASASGHAPDKHKKRTHSRSACTKSASGKCVAAGQYCSSDGSKARDAKGQRLTCRKHHWKRG